MPQPDRDWNWAWPQKNLNWRSWAQARGKLEQELERVLLLLEDAQVSTEQDTYPRSPTQIIKLAQAQWICKRCEGRQKFIQVGGFAAAHTQQQIREDGAKGLGPQRSSWVRKAQVGNHRGTHRCRRNYRNDLRFKDSGEGTYIILKKHRNLIFNLDSSLSSCRTPLLVLSPRAQEASKKLVAERLDIEKLLKKIAHLLYKSSPWLLKLQPGMFPLSSIA